VIEGLNIAATLPSDAVSASANITSPSTAALLASCLQRQRQAHAAHPMPTLAERNGDLRTLARFVHENQQALEGAISADYGQRSAHETRLTEIGPVLASVRHALRHLRSWMRVQRRGVDRLAFGLASNRVMPQPLGVVGVIVPWNFPLNLSLIPLCGIFAAGNRAMVKMSENSRQLAQLLIARLPAYFPPEKLQVFDETGGVGVAFSKLPFDHLLFTGSGATGRAVMAAAAQNLCPVTLELGGKAPAIVCDDFDLRLAAERILFVKYLNAGQICTTVDHVFVPRAQVQAFVELAREIVAQRYLNLNSPDYTSIIDSRAFERLRDALDEARAQGATVLPLIEPAFDAARHRIAPHIVLGAREGSELMQREIFGPILPVVPYDALNEVITRINAGPKPLAIYPFSNQRERIDRFIEGVMSGGVSVNDALLHVGQEELPFGGVGESGMGHYHGEEGFLAFSKLRPVFYQSRWSTLAMLMPPYGRMAERVLKFLTR
jgi:coniferyl-aldehyde dehydrogenase